MIAYDSYNGCSNEDIWEKIITFLVEIISMHINIMRVK